MGSGRHHDRGPSRQSLELCQLEVRRQIVHARTNQSRAASERRRRRPPSLPRCGTSCRTASVSEPNARDCRTRTRGGKPAGRASAGAAVAQSSGNSPAIGTRSQPFVARHSPGSAASGMGSLMERQRWRRWPSVSMFSSTGPRSSATRRSWTPASVSQSSSPALAARSSTPSRQPTRNPRRAAASEQ